MARKDFLKEKIASPDIEYWPEVRWWLPGGLNIDSTLREEVKKIHDKGFGATEFLALPDYGAPNDRYGWGSEEWIHDSKVIIEEDTKYGMGASMTSGANWSNANLTTITPDDRAASKELDFTCRILKPGETFDGELEKCALTMPGIHDQILIAAAAVRIVKKKKKVTILSPDSTLLLTDQVKEGRLTWTAPADGKYILFAFWMHGTGQTAEPSYKTSYTINYIDHYGIDAWIRYWDETVLTPDLKALIKKNGRIQIYMDSLELSTFGKGGNLWGYDLLTVFKERRGYDLTPHLPVILREGSGMMGNLEYYYDYKDTEMSGKIRNDLYQTMTDMYIENILQPIQEYCHKNSMTLRAEISYGVTFEISQPGKYVDGIETESLEFASQIDSHRGLAGTAHVYNKIYSSETGAALRNYMMGLEWYTQIVYTQFAAGVSKTVLHGYSGISGSEEGTYWPGHEGMMPIFSERFGERQPSWRHMEDWTKMISRYQMLLRQGRPRMDLAILRTDYFYNNQVMFLGMENEEKPLTEDEFYNSMGMRANQGLYWQDCSLQNAGYTYDYLDPSMLFDMELTEENGRKVLGLPGYQALVIYQEALSRENAERVLSLAEKGFPVLIANGIEERIRNNLFVRHKAAAIRTPFLDGGEEELSVIMKKLRVLPNVFENPGYAYAGAALAALRVYPRAAFLEPSANMLPLLRDNEEENIRYLYLYNVMCQESTPSTVTVQLSGKGIPYRVNCWTGEVCDDFSFYYKGGTGEVYDDFTFDFKECRTVLDVTLNPGEAAIFALDLSETASSGRRAEFSITDMAPISLTDWELSVEDWNEGEKTVLTEDRGLGYITREVHYETRKDRIDAGKVSLVPWKDIEAVGPAVSGIGYYKTTFELPQELEEGTQAVLKLGSVNHNTARVIVNGSSFPVDFNAPDVNITSAVKSGRNEIVVEVSSTLNNRLLERGYYGETVPASFINGGDFGGGLDMKPELASLMSLQNEMAVKTSIKDYGLTGKAEIVF